MAEAGREQLRILSEHTAQAKEVMNCISVSPVTPLHQPSLKDTPTHTLIQGSTSYGMSAKLGMQTSFHWHAAPPPPVSATRRDWGSYFATWDPRQCLEDLHFSGEEKRFIIFSELFPLNHGRSLPFLCRAYQDNIQWIALGTQACTPTQLQPSYTGDQLSLMYEKATYDSTFLKLHTLNLSSTF